MIKAVVLESFRGIREGTLDQLTSLVILVGPNGSGKSSILDALLIGAGAMPPQAFQEVLRRRESPIPGRLETAMPWLLYKGRAADATIRVTSEAGLARTTHLERHPQNPQQLMQTFSYSAVGSLSPEEQGFLNAANLHHNRNNFTGFRDISEVRILEPTATSHKPLHELYTEAYRVGLSKQAKSLLMELLPGAEDIVILTENGQPVVHIAYPDFSLPVAMAGDGIRLLIQQSFELAGPEGSTVLLEEPEAHLHPGAIRNSAKAVVAAIKRKQQIILTTHSLEYIDAVLDASSDTDLDRISLFRIALDQGSLKVARLSGREIALARQTIEDDLR